MPHLRLAATLLCLACADAALAQPSAEIEAEIEEVLVTARKQEQRAMDVPIALSVLQGETLGGLRASGRDIRFLSGRVPSLQITSSYGRVFPTSSCVALATRTST